MAALAWTPRGTLLVGEHGHLIERRPGAIERMLFMRGVSSAATALAVCKCVVLVGWDDGAVHTVHVPHALPRGPYYDYSLLRESCGTPTSAVALASEVGAAAVQARVDVWCGAGARRLEVGTSVTALCLHGGWLLVGAGAAGRVEVWEPRHARRTGTLAGTGDHVTLLAADRAGGIIRCSVERGVVVERSRPPMRRVEHWER